MTAKILVATPLEALGELICQTLENAAGYSVEFAGRSSAVIETCRRAEFDLIILDADLDDAQRLSSLGKNLAVLQPAASLVILMAENSARPTPLKEVSVRAYLTKPFFIPALLETVSSALVTAPLKGRLRKETPPVPGGPPATFWEDTAGLTRFLDRWLAGAPARGALLAAENRLLATSAGLADSPALEDLTDLLTRYAQSTTTSDLARFLHLPAINDHVMLYAVHVPPASARPEVGRLALGLIFEAGEPFSAGKAQAVRMITALTDPFLEDEPFENPPVEEDTAPAIAAGPEPAAEEREPASTGEDVDAASPAEDVQDTAVEPPSVGVEWDTSTEVEPGEEQSLADLSTLLEDLPSPDPPSTNEVQHSWVRETTGEPAPGLTRADLDERPSVRRPADGAPDGRAVDTVISPAEWVVAEELPEPVPPSLPLKKVGAPTTVQLADPMDPLPAEIYHLPFTCILIPRLPGHFLTGDLANSLSQWLPQICLAYGWRLEGLAVRPEYFQWMVRIPPTTAPDDMLTTLRKQTSQQIFENFPRLKAENASGEFWAPGYLILSGIQYASNTLLADYIRHTRQRQGIID